MGNALTVVIDPGHYSGYNKGVVPGYFEGNMTWKLAQFLKEYLEQDGVKVIMTRSDPAKDMSVYSRGQVAVKSGADVFISLHSNAIGDSSRWEKAYGVSVYRSEYLPDSVDLGNKLADAIVDVMRPVTGVTFSRGVLTRVGSSGSDYYGVIRGAVSGAKSIASATNGPVKHAFIIEHGFHTQSNECAFLNNDANLRRIAAVEANVIGRHFGLISTPEVGRPTNLRLTGGSEADVWDFCKKKGLNDIAAAAVCAQARAEGNFNSCNLQDAYENSIGLKDDEYVVLTDIGGYTNFVHDKAGFGLFQWTYWSRKQGLYDYAKKLGVSIGDFQMQMEFFWEEINTTHKGVLSSLQNAADISETTDLVTKGYEAPADQSEKALEKRRAYAREAYAKYAEATAPANPTIPEGVIGSIKIIYEGTEGLNIHTTPEWGDHNLNTKNGPVHHGEVYRVTDKIKFGLSVMYKLYSGAGYITGNETYVTFTPENDAASAPVQKEIKVGSVVNVLKAVTYSGASFKLYYKNYDVISVSGDRVVIGRGKTVTCAIHKNNLRAV